MREGVVGSAVDGRLDAVRHFPGRHQRFPGSMTAALGLDLILQVHPGRTGLDQVLARTRNVEGCAPAGVGVYEQGQVRRRGDPTDVFADVVEHRDTEVRKAERRVRHARPGEIDRPETGSLGKQRAEGVDGSDDL